MRLGVGLAPEFGVAVRSGVLDADALAEELALPLDVAPPEAVPLAEPVAVPLAEPVAVPLAEPVAVLVDVGGVWVGGGVDEEEDGEHAATATARMAKTPKRETVSFALSTGLTITRTVM